MGMPSFIVLRPLVRIQSIIPTLILWSLSCNRQKSMNHSIPEASWFGTEPFPNRVCNIKRTLLIKVLNPMAIGIWIKAIDQIMFDFSHLFGGDNRFAIRRKKKVGIPTTQSWSCQFWRESEYGTTHRISVLPGSGDIRLPRAVGQSNPWNRI